MSGSGSARTLRLGISTCPNDTFAFHALLEGRVATPGLELDIRLDDVEQLNQALLGGELDVAKVSFAAALEAGQRWVVLPVGSALGFGVGPLLLAAPGRTRADLTRRNARVLCPGRHTTATLLYRLLHAAQGTLEQVVFSEILPRLARGAADFGVCIHEGRFTYADHGLQLIEDLGASWEARTGGPLPLGGIAAQRELGSATHAALTDAIRASLDHGLAHRDETLATMRKHATELADDVLWAHVELYVNDWTRDLGDVGRAALGELDRRAREAGLVAAHARGIEIVA